MSAYYNENDPKTAAWLRELIKAGAIAPGEVDERDVQDVRPSELAGYTQCHFFAGIGGWSYALRLAGWPDDRPVWTGSVPCQPFSTGGKGEGFADERHLWPDWFHLIQQRLPVTVFGEQVSSPDGLTWLDVVRADLEGETYAVGCADLCAAGVGAPEIRQRTYFVAESDLDGFRAGRRRGLHSEGEAIALAPYSQPAGVVDYAAEPGLAIGVDRQDAGPIVGVEGGAARVPGVTRGFWADAEWIYCRDKKWRPVEPGTFPLVDGATARVVRLRGYGNAIVAPLAAEFIKAYMSIAL